MELFVELPNAQERWKNLKVGLTDLAEKKVKGLEAFEQFVCENTPSTSIFRSRDTDWIIRFSVSTEEQMPNLFSIWLST